MESSTRAPGPTWQPASSTESRTRAPAATDEEQPTQEPTTRAPADTSAPRPTRLGGATSPLSRAPSTTQTPGAASRAPGAGGPGRRPPTRSRLALRYWEGVPASIQDR